MRHPEALFDCSSEWALVAPDDGYILRKHFPCAAHERPLTSRDEELFGPRFADAMVELERDSFLEYRGDCWHFRGIDHPAEKVNLRSLSASKIAILDESQSYRVMEELDATTAPVRVYPGAIYLHQGQSYLITHLGLDMGIAYAAPADTNYYTQPREANSLEIGQTWQKKRMLGSNAHLDELRGSQQVIGYRRLQQFSDTAFRASAEHARTGIHHGEAMVRLAANRRMNSAETRTGLCGRASRCRARGDRHPASLCHV